MIEFLCYSVAMRLLFAVCSLFCFRVFYARGKPYGFYGAAGFVYEVYYEKNKK